MITDLPTKTQRERDATRTLLDRARSGLPFGAVTAGCKSPPARMVHQTMPEAGFFRQEYPRLNVTVWLFASAAERAQFLSVYVGESLGLIDGSTAQVAVSEAARA